MDKVRPWCGQPSDRGRLKNRTELVFVSRIIFWSGCFASSRLPRPGQLTALPHPVSYATVELARNMFTTANCQLVQFSVVAETPKGLKKQHLYKALPVQDTTVTQRPIPVVYKQCLPVR